MISGSRMKTSDSKDDEIRLKVLRVRRSGSQVFGYIRFPG
jgi:hypothetical protein